MRVTKNNLSPQSSALIKTTYYIKRKYTIIIASFAFLIYAQSIFFDYTLDDQASIQQNKIVRQGLKGIPTLLTTDYWYGFSETYRMKQYRPASLVLFAIEWQFFPGNAKAAHLANVLLYSILCAVLFILLTELFAGTDYIVPFFCMVLYAAHPIHTEVVNSIKSSDELLCFLFAALSMLSFVRYIKTELKLYLLLGLNAFFVAFLSKETAVTFLVIIPLLLFVFTKADFKKLLFVFLALAATTGIYLLIRQLIVQSIVNDIIESSVNNSLYAAPDFISRQATAFNILLRYIFLLFIPHPLCYDYSFAQIETQSVFSPGALAGLLVYFAMGIYAVINIRKKNIIAFAVLFYLLALSVTSNVFMLIGATMAERFLFIPSLGYCLLLTVVLTKLTKFEQTATNKWNSVKQIVSTNNPFFIICLVIASLYSVKTIARSRVWENNGTLFGTDVQISTNSARTHYNWGIWLLQNAYDSEKDRNKKKEILDQSVEELKKAITIYDNSPEYYLNLGKAYSKKQDPTNAILNFEMALKITPAPDAQIFDKLSYEYLQANRLQEALNMADSAIDYNPLLATAYNNKGCALGRLNKIAESIPPLLKSIELDSAFATAYKNTAVSYYLLGQYPYAIRYFNKTLALDPANSEAGILLGRSYLQMGDTLTANNYLNKYSNPNAGLQ